MTYIEHDRECNIFKDDRLHFAGGICNCSARYARWPLIMGPHEEGCIYIETRPAGTVVHHGICYCSADPHHDETCKDWTCPFWTRRSGLIIAQDTVA